MRNHAGSVTGNNPSINAFMHDQLKYHAEARMTVKDITFQRFGRLVALRIGERAACGTFMGMEARSCLNRKSKRP